jgi:hypothetical protein
VGIGKIPKMAQFKKEEVFGPAVEQADAHSTVVEGDDSPFSADSPLTRSAKTRSEGLPDFLKWASRHRRLAIFGAFGVGVFFGAVVRR